MKGRDGNKEGCMGGKEKENFDRQQVDPGALMGQALEINVGGSGCGMEPVIEVDILTQGVKQVDAPL